MANTYRLEFFDGQDFKRGRQAIRRARAKLLSAHERTGVATVELVSTPAKARKVLAQLSAGHGLRALRRHAFKRTSNDVATEIMQTRGASSAPLNLTGKGETIAVCDTGIDLGSASHIHPDFAGRVAAIELRKSKEGYRWSKTLRCWTVPRPMHSLN
jgi:serine protease AprX